MMYLRSGFTMAQLPHTVLETPLSQNVVYVVIMKSLLNVSQSDQTTLIKEVFGDFMFWH